MSDLNKLLFDFSNSNASTVKPHHKPNDVMLYVYDLADKLNSYLRYGFKAYAHVRGMPEKIIMHTSVVVHGNEYSFGTNGVTITPVGEQSGDLKPLNFYFMGRTAFTPTSVAAVVQALIDQEKFIGTEYDLRDKNCNYFSDALLKEIVGKGLPKEWLHLSKHANGLVKRFVPAGLLATASALDEISPEDESPPDEPTLIAIANSLETAVETKDVQASVVNTTSTTS